MNSPLQSTPFEIGGYTFQIGVLNFEDARPAYVKLQRLLQANEEVLETAGIGLFMFAGMSGQLTDEDIKYYVDLFGKVTTVAVSGQQTVFLKDNAARNLLFGGRIELMFDWLDAATEVNFAGAREKLVAARKRLAEKAARDLAAAKAEPK